MKSSRQSSFLTQSILVTGLLRKAILAYFIILSVEQIAGFPDGAPSGSCDRMEPGHGVDQQASLFPYSLNVSKTRVAPGEKIEIHLASRTSSGPFKGFLAIGRDSKLSNPIPQGKFIREIKSNPEDESLAQLLTCTGYPDSAATHTNNTKKSDVILEWEAPTVDGEYVIAVTVVKEKDIFWIAYRSEVITVGMGGQPDPEDEIEKIYNGCSTIKGCFGTPMGCLSTKNCEMFVTYNVDTDNAGVTFELVGNITSVATPTSFLALGLSSDAQMSEDSVFACRLDKDEVAINEYYTRPKYEANYGVMRPVGEEIINKASGENIDGFISCTFNVHSKYSLPGGNRDFNLKTDEFYFLLARGDDSSATVLHKHPKVTDRVVAPAAVQLTDKEGPKPTPTTTLPPPTGDVAEFYKECGLTKGCFGLGSASCVDNLNCGMLVTYQITSTGANLELVGRQVGDSNSYIAVGLSFDNQMGNDDVFGCRIPNGGGIAINEYYNQPNKDGNDAVTRDGSIIISKAQGAVIDGYITCSFTIPTEYEVPTAAGSLQYNLVTDNYYLLLARGANSDGTYLDKHPAANDRDVSAQSIKLSDMSVLKAKSKIYIQLHGSFMILAWLLCASSGMFTARYYKQTLTQKQPFGLALWFHFHRLCMVLTVVFTIAAFVLIFIEVGGYTSRSGGRAEKAHPILGIILTALALLQVCLATFRPHPGTPKRKLFNWVHWSIGNTAHIFGIACIYLANDLGKTNLQQTRYWAVITAFIVYHITLHLLLTAHTFSVDKEMRIQETKRALSVGPMAPAGVAGEAPGTKIRTMILAAYILGAAVTAISLIYFVVDAVKD